MRIAVMGQAAFGAKVLETLLDRRKEVIAAWLPQGKAPARPDPLEAAARERGIPAFRPESYKSSETLESFRQTRPDLLVMAFVTDIIPRAIIDASVLGSICYHPSLLPRHRGGSAINWAIIMGDRETGLTIFWADAGIDTGPILLQKRVPIGEDDTTGSLYFNRLFPLGVEAIMESVELIEAGKAPRLAQDEALATYEPLCNDKVARINWQLPGQEVYNLVRGCDPQPGAYTFFKGEKVRLLEARLKQRTSGGRPGEITALDEGGFAVSLVDGSLSIAKVRTDTGKMEAASWAKEKGLRPGDTFQDA